MRCWLTAGVIAVALLAAALAAASGLRAADAEAAFLAGVGAVRVEVTLSGPSALEPSALRSRIVRMLGDSGVMVAPSPATWANAPGRPLFTIALSFVAGQGCAFQVRADITEAAIGFGGLAGRAHVKSWMSAGWVSLRDCDDLAVQTLQRQVGQFAEIYREANGRGVSQRPSDEGPETPVGDTAVGASGTVRGVDDSRPGAAAFRKAAVPDDVCVRVEGFAKERPAAVKAVVSAFRDLGVHAAECADAAQPPGVQATVHVSAGVVELKSPSVCVVGPIVALEQHGFIARTGRATTATIWRRSPPLTYVLDDVALQQKCASAAIERAREEISGNVQRITD